jgi:hypothetical protein
MVPTLPLDVLRYMNENTLRYRLHTRARLRITCSRYKKVLIPTTPLQLLYDQWHRLPTLRQRIYLEMHLLPRMYDWNRCDHNRVDNESVAKYMEQQCCQQSRCGPFPLMDVHISLKTHRLVDEDRS